MYFNDADRAGQAVADMAQSIYHKRHLLNESNEKQIKLEFRIGVGEPDVYVILIYQGHMIYYTISDKPCVHMSKEEKDNLVFRERDEDTDYLIRASSGRYYIFNDLLDKAVENAIKKAMGPNTDSLISILDAFPVSIEPRTKLPHIFN